jgi:hypothetical protein
VKFHGQWLLKVSLKEYHVAREIFVCRRVLCSVLGDLCRSDATGSSIRITFAAEILCDPLITDHGMYDIPPMILVGQF